MIDPPIASPVATETMPAASRINDRGSSNRRNIARNRLSALAFGVAVGSVLCEPKFGVLRVQAPLPQ